MRILYHWERGAVPEESIRWERGATPSEDRGFITITLDHRSNPAERGNGVIRTKAGNFVARDAWHWEWPKSYATFVGMFVGPAQPGETCEIQVYGWLK